MNPRTEAEWLVKIFKEDFCESYSKQMIIAKLRANIVIQEAEAALEQTKDSVNYFKMKEHYKQVRSELSKL